MVFDHFWIFLWTRMQLVWLFWSTVWFKYGRRSRPAGALFIMVLGLIFIITIVKHIYLIRILTAQPGIWVRARMCECRFACCSSILFHLFSLLFCLIFGWTFNLNKERYYVVLCVFVFDYFFAFLFIRFGIFRSINWFHFVTIRMSVIYWLKEVCVLIFCFVR